MSQPDKRASLGGAVGPPRDQPAPGRATSMPDIADVPPGPAPLAGKKKKEGRRKEERGTSAAGASGPPTTSAPARAAPTPATSRQHAAVPVRPAAFRPVPTQAPGPAAYPGRAPQARAAAPPARVPAPARTPAIAAGTAAPRASPTVAARPSAPLQAPPASATRTAALRAPPAPTARARAAPVSHIIAPPPRFSTPPAPASHTAAPGSRRSLTGPAFAERERLALMTPQAPYSPAPPRSSAYDSPAMLSTCSSRAGSSMSLASAGSAASGRDDVSLDTTPRSGQRPTVGGGDASRTTTPTPLGFDFEFQLGDTRPQRRRRSSGDAVEAEEEAKRYCLDPPRPPRSRASRGRAEPASPTFADTVRRTPPPTLTKTTAGVSAANLPLAPPDATVPPATSPGTATTATTKQKPGRRLRYPPLVVERLPNWAAHFRAITAKLGRPPNARPYGAGVRFSPDTEEEYRLVQRYLTGLEKDSGVSWFAYSLPADKKLKVAIRGLPADTNPEEIEEELQALGYQPEYVRHIKGAQGRPGCVFHAVLKKTPDVRAIYGTTVFMHMRGVKIEAWRGKRGPAQCHRCQRFRHSSHQCHRPLACVRCGDGHAARDCPRPREEPATCANCGGPHPASNLKCPVYQAEIRNRRAGTVAITATMRRPQMATERPDAVVVEAQGTTLMAASNGPTDRTQATSSRRRKRKRGGKRKGKKPEPPATQEDIPTAGPALEEAQAVDIQETTASAVIAQRNTGEPTSQDGRSADASPARRQQVEDRFPESTSGVASGAHTTDKKAFTACAIKLMMDLIRAIRQGQEIETIILDGLADLLILRSGLVVERPWDEAASPPPSPTGL